jgi:hypothetical protein
MQGRGVPRGETPGVVATFGALVWTTGQPVLPWKDRGRENGPIAAARVAATKKMAAKNLETNMAMLVMSSKGIHPRFYVFLRAREA